MARLNRGIKLAIYVAGLHHLFHLFVQPQLDKFEFYQNLPFIFKGSTAAVTVFIFLITLFFYRRIK